MADELAGDELRGRVDGALEIARDAAARLREHFRRGPARIDRKRDGSLVTEADREVERAICSALEGAFPADGRLGEEFGEAPGRSGFRWVIDPIDGTVSFVHGVPLFGTLIGLEHDGRPVAGVIAMPALEEMVWGGRRLGAWRSLRGEVAPARVSGTGDVAEALFCTTSTNDYSRRGQLDVFLRLARRFGRMRGWSDCYGYALLATGRCDAVVEPEVHWWDIAAPIAIVEAAGGRFTDWRGGAPGYAAGATLATNGLIHEGALGVIRGDGGGGGG